MNDRNSESAGGRVGKATVQAGFGANVGNAHHTDHSTEQTPSAALAEEATVDYPAMIGRSSAKGDNGFSIYRVRCTRMIGRWLASRS